METLERNHRRRHDICSDCGWHLLLEEDGRYTCCNTECFEVGKPKGPKLHFSVP